MDKPTMPTNKQIDTAMCNISLPYFHDMRREDSERTMQRFVRELWSVCYGQPAQPAEDDAENQWRRLALQFDDHRMKAIGWLKAVVERLPEQVAAPVKEFLKAPPLSGEKVLAERLAAMAQPSASAEPFAVIVSDVEVSDPGAFVCKLTDGGMVSLGDKLYGAPVAAQPRATIPVEDSIAWQSTGSGVDRTAVMVAGRSWYRDDDPKVAAQPSVPAYAASIPEGVITLPVTLAEEEAWQQMEHRS